MFLSCALPGAPPEGIGEDEVQIAIVQTEPQEKGGGSTEELLQSSPVVVGVSGFSGEKEKDPKYQIHTDRRLIS